MPDEMNGKSEDAAVDEKKVAEEKDLFEVNTNEMSDEELGEKIMAEDKEFMGDYEDITIDDLISHGFVTHKVKIGEKISAEIRTLKSAEDKSLGAKSVEYKGPEGMKRAESGDDTLELSLISFGETVFASPKEVRVFIDGQSIAIKTLLLQEFVKLNKALSILLRGPGVQNPLVTPLTGIGSL